jgi:hypothetical protein
MRATRRSMSCDTGSGYWHLNAFRLHKDRQANAYPKEEVPAKGRNERKKCQAGETVTMTDGRQR